MEKYTPMMQQYLKIKKENPDSFLFFRLGDFYELFFEDATLASRELEITLTGRGGGPEERIPMCGVPYHAAKGYIQRLIEKGYKVAICEQVEDPATAKGVVKREVTQIITPGTFMDQTSHTNNFMVGLFQGETEFGFIACDLSTGEMHVTSFALEKQRVLDELSLYMPSELIAPSHLIDLLAPLLRMVHPHLVLTSWEQCTLEQAAITIREKTWSSLSSVRQQVVGMLFAYLMQTQKRALKQLGRVHIYEHDQYLILDPFSRKNLEIVQTARDGQKSGSLLWLLDQTRTAMGARMLRKWIDKPLLDKEAIERRLEAVETFVNQYMLREEIKSELQNIYDLERLVGRIAYGNVSAKDLIALRDSLLCLPNLKYLCEESGSQSLLLLAKQMYDCTDVVELITEAIIDDPPLSVTEGGIIKEGYHQQLDEYKQASTNGKQWIAQLEKREREQTGIKSLKIGFNKVFGYYIEVTKANVHLVPQERFERKQTLTNAERYSTPELKEKESLILEAQDRMITLEYELFCDVRMKLTDYVTILQSIAEKIAAIDVLHTFAAVSAAQGYVKPEIHLGFDLTIHEGRHPVVEKVLQQESFMANDTSLSSKNQQITLITGPNMAGKSTYMRQVAIICLMAQMGCFVPAKYAFIPIIDRMFTRIGAADDLTSGQSTFMVEMKDIQLMTEKATKNSLIIIDELGRGTSTTEGMAIAQAVIEHVHEALKCKALVSTHFHELAHLEEDLPHLKNYCMAVEEQADRVIFLRKLIPGAASTSYGIYCAKLAGLPESIITRSYYLLKNLENPKSIQLSLFDVEEPVKPTFQKSSSELKYKKFIQNLQQIDVMNLTPIQALSALNELVDKSKELERITYDKDQNT